MACHAHNQVVVGVLLGLVWPWRVRRPRAFRPRISLWVGEGGGGAHREETPVSPRADTRSCVAVRVRKMEVGWGAVRR